MLSLLFLAVIASLAVMSFSIRNVAFTRVSTCFLLGILAVLMFLFVALFREQEVGTNTMRVERGFWQSILQVRWDIADGRAAAANSLLAANGLASNSAFRLLGTCRWLISLLKFGRNIYGTRPFSTFYIQNVFAEYVDSEKNGLSGGCFPYLRPGMFQRS